MPTLQFKGKTFVQNHHLAVPYHQLLPQKDKSSTEKVSLNDNLIVQGDNLLALKALLPTYAGKVKCIYIDPPYNTGNEGWVYSDNVKSPVIKEWIGKVVGKEGEDLVRHDKWLSMMMPRLKLLRELLTDDGAIFVSIDDDEQHHLRNIMDEIFGEDNFINNIIWQKKYTRSNDAKWFSDNHDFILAYAKDKSSWKLNKLPRTEKMNSRYTNPDNDPRGSWKATPLHAKSGSRREEVTFSNGMKWIPPVGTFNRYATSSLKKAEKEGRLYLDAKVPVLKKYLTDMGEIVPLTIWTFDEVGSNDHARKELKDIFDNNPFDTPKPTSLIKQILSIATDKDSIVLDSFAGSGTTAQAVLELNKEDGGNRKFIMVEMEDYANSITAERVRRVIKGVPKSKNKLVKEGLGGSFSYFELGKAIDMESLLSGKSLPKFEDLARYLFYTATGEEFKPDAIDESSHFIGSTDDFDVLAFYKPDLNYLKTTSLTLDEAKRLREKSGTKPLLVFAPTKYVEQQTLDALNITFCQLPFEIYRMKK